MNNISIFFVPAFVIFIIGYAVFKHVNIYEAFLRGAREGIDLLFDIAPTIIAMVFAINLFINSSVIDYLLFFFKEPLQAMKLPVMIVPMGLLRPISGTATLAIMSSIMASYGPDSFAGNLAAVLQGCTDTTIYVLALYFGSVGVTKTRHALASGLIADIVGIVMAFIISYLFFW